MKTTHKYFFGNSSNMQRVQDNSVDLVVTSPPYPMIEMWDDIFSSQNPSISSKIRLSPDEAFELMHQELDKTWKECVRIIKFGGFLCINIGDATRSINGNFQLYNNHSRIIRACSYFGFTGLPNIIWRKQTNSPNKFMGSGMLPCGAYVTLEHEWILIFRKGEKRVFESTQDKLARMHSSFFWEERNIWFSDLWDIKGTKQNLQKSKSRARSAAYPLEIPYRLINMFSQKGDTVLDPFMGTGTTMQAAILLGRNSIGYDIDICMKDFIKSGIDALDLDRCNNLIRRRLDNHVAFVNDRIKSGKEVRHFNSILNVPVMTKQEEKIEFNYLHHIASDDNLDSYNVEYLDKL